MPYTYEFYTKYLKYSKYSVGSEELRKWWRKSNNLIYHISRTYSKAIRHSKNFSKDVDIFNSKNFIK